MGSARFTQRHKVELLQQQDTPIGVDITTPKIGLNATPFTDWELKRFLGTDCHRQNLS